MKQSESFMNRNVSLLLLVLIVVSIIALVGGTVYFQGLLVNLTREHDSTTSALDRTSSQLKLYQDKYNETLAFLNESVSTLESEKADLRQVYTLTKTEMEDLVSDLNASLTTTSRDLSDTKEELKDTTSNLFDANKKVTSLETNIATLQTEVADKQSTIVSLQDDKNRLQDDIDEYEQTCNIT